MSTVAETVAPAAPSRMYRKEGKETTLSPKPGSVLLLLSSITSLGNVPILSRFLYLPDENRVYVCRQSVLASVIVVEGNIRYAVRYDRGSEPRHRY